MTSELIASVVLAFLAVSSFVLVHPEKSNSIQKIAFLTGLFVFLVFTIVHLVADFFTSRGIDESVVYHLVYGLKGSGFSEYSALIIMTIVALLLAVSLLYVVHKAEQFGTRSLWLLFLSIIFLSLSFVFHPVVKWLSTQNSEFKSVERFDDYYREPTLNPNDSGNRKNLVFIYAEGLERTWFDDTLFPGVTPNLRELSRLALDFRNIRQMPYTGWTMAGIVATQCGLPLLIPSYGNAMSGTDLFLPGATCLGDLLAALGYHSEFYGGADLDFSGKGNFFRTHGFSSVNGKEELSALIEKPQMSGWGLYDEDLLELTYQRFETLSEMSKPFALFALTLDTHHPNGIPSGICEDMQLGTKQDLKSMLFAVRCSDHLIYEFINKIRISPYAEQTLVVLVSDHLSIKNSATHLLKNADRRQLFLMLPGWDNVSSGIDTVGTPFDVGATTLGYLGFSTDIGFGRNLLDGKSVFNENQNVTGLFKFWSKYLDEFWEFPNLGNGILAIPSEGILRIDKNLVKIPVLIPFDDNLDTKLIFDFFAEMDSQKLETAYRKLEIDTPFAFVAECKNFERTGLSQKQHEICLMLGRKGGQSNKVIHLEDSLHVSKEEFVNVIKEPKLLKF